MKATEGRLLEGRLAAAVLPDDVDELLPMRRTGRPLAARRGLARAGELALPAASEASLPASTRRRCRVGPSSDIVESAIDEGWRRRTDMRCCDSDEKGAALAESAAGEVAEPEADVPPLPSVRKEPKEERSSAPEASLALEWPAATSRNLAGRILAPCGD